MKSVIEFLEKFVQWIAMGLGALWLVYMCWAYLLNPALTSTTINGEAFTAGNLDQHILDTTVQRYNQKVEDHTAVTFVVPSFTDSVIKAFTAPAVSYSTYAGPWADTMLPPPLSFNESQQVVQSTQAANGPIAELPVLPPATVLSVEVGRSMVQVPSAAPAVGVAGPAAPPADPTPVSMDWTTVFAKVPMAAIKDAFAKAYDPAKKPAGTFTTYFLSVTLHRQRLLADGTWGDDTVVKRLSNNAFPTPLPPDGLASMNDQLTYRQWAMNNAKAIANPDFYNIVAGSVWAKYSDWTLGPPAPLPPLMPAAPAAPAPVVAPPVPAAPARPAAAPARPPARAATPAPAAAPSVVAQPAAPAAPPPPDLLVPTGPIDPAQAADVIVYMHDDSVKPNENYRYSIQYGLYNAVFDRADLVAKPELATTFTLSSPDPDAHSWSQAVTIEPRTQLFLAQSVSLGANARSARFDIYTWNDGGWQMQTFAVAEGDEIGQNKDAVNYKTGWSLVELQVASSDHTAVIVNDTYGRVQSRVGKEEARNEDKFKKDHLPQATAATAAPVNVPGQPAAAPGRPQPYSSTPTGYGPGSPGFNGY